jgi:hypothetical protein
MKYIDDMDKNIESAVKKMVKGKKSVKKSTASEEPKDAVGWLKKAYIDNDPADGAPKVGDIGYV